MSVDEPTVKSGDYEDQEPAPINRRIINHLQQNNPIPPETILSEALKSEKRILKL